MPQLRHGYIGVLEVTVPGSKFVGTGFENEQVEQTHVALFDFGESGLEASIPFRIGPRGMGDGLELRKDELDSCR